MFATGRWRMVLLAGSISLAAPLHSGAQQEGAGLPLAEFEISAEDRELIVPVTFDDRTYDFVVDTGASCVIFDEALKPRLGEVRARIPMQVPHGITTLELFDAPDAHVGGLSLRTDAPVACSDLGGVRMASGKEIYGIIGMSFLKDHVIEIDFDGGRLAFLPSADLATGRRVPIVSLANMPAVDALVEGAGSQRFVIDTGAALAGSFHERLFDWLLERDAMDVVKTSLCMDLSGSHRMRDGKIKGLSLGDFRHSGLILSSSAPSVPNSLGFDYWKRYHVVLDFPNRALYLNKGRKFDEADTFDLSGLHFLLEGGRVVIKVVDGGSPAARGGIHPGDVLLEVDELDAASMPLHRLRRRFHSGGVTIRLAIQRGERVLDVPLDLPDPEASPESAER